MTATLDEQISEVKREIGQRKRLYPRWVGLGRMTQAEADRKLATLEAVRLTLEALRDAARAANKPTGLFD